MFKTKYRDEIQSFCITFFALLIFYFQVISSGYYYQDDEWRAVQGRIELAGQGRPLAELLLKLFTVNGKLLDATPLMQLFAIGLMGLTAVCVGKYSSKIKPKIAALITISVYATPFFLQNMSYKFDSFHMTASVFIAFLAPLSFNIRKNSLSFLSFYLCSLSVLFLYQASINTVFIVALSVIVVKNFNEKNNTLKDLSLLAFCLTAALITYKISLNLPWFSPNEYSESHSQTMSLKSIFPDYLYNAEKFLSFANSNLTYSYKLFFCITLALSILAVFFRYKDNKKDFLKKSTFSLTALMVSFVAIIGMLGLLKNPVYQPRVLVGFTGIVFFLSYLVFSIEKNNIFRALLTFSLSACILSSAIVSSVYGNALSHLKSYNSFKIGNIAEQVNHFALENKADSMTVKGSIDFPSIVNMARYNIPIIRTMLSPELNETWLGGVYAASYGKSDNIKYIAFKKETMANIKEKYCQTRPDYASFSYEIRTVDKMVIVDFDRTCEN